jgi:uncharacterized phage-associated protein
MPERPYSASTIAKWFIVWATKDEADRSNLKIQKLLYFAQGHFLGASGEILFTDDIEAWAHGPVVPSLYREYKTFGSGDIEMDEDFDFNDIDDETTEFLVSVWERYGGYAAWTLRNMTHSERPWIVAFERGPNHTISTESLQHFFSVQSPAGD